MAAGQPAAAEAPLREALALRRKRLPRGHGRIAETAGLLGECLTAQGRYGEAEPLLKESYRAFRNRFGERHPETVEALTRWTNFLRATGREATPEQD